MSSYLVYAFITVVVFAVLNADVQGQSFRVSEGQEQGQFIGNVAQSIELQKSIQNLTLNLSLLQYTIFTKGNPLAKHFTIDESTGAVYTVGALDREALCSPEESPCTVHLDISAHNAAGFLRILNVQVIVEDINDNAPVFPQSLVSIQIPESEPLNSTFTFRGATDADSVGINSQIAYEMISSGTPFDMTIIPYQDRTQDVGLVVARKLDREKTPKYQLQILAKDGGNPQRTGTVYVEVSITDVNDNYPEFTTEFYTVTIRENLPSRTPVLQVSAMDLDAGVNGNVTYKFVTETQAFVINSTTGEVFVGKGVDYEQQQVYRLMVEASDKASVPKTRKAMVIVNVSDVNDNSPEMSFNFLSGGDQALIDEHSVPDTFVAFMSVSDKDSGNNAKVNCKVEGDRYALATQNTNEFSITLRVDLDRESQSKDSVSVVCVDSGSPALTSTSGFEVVIQDINDHAPVFPRTNYSVTVLEGVGIGTVLLNVSATDKDSGENGRISYSIEGERASMFSVSNIGKVWVNQRPDRELQEVITIFLVATDNGSPPKSTSASINVTIIDVNDEIPVFTKMEYRFNVTENVNEGPVGKVTADDRDLGLGGEVQYRLSSNYDSQYFTIDKDTGVITLNQILDRENRAIRELIVIAEDKGTPRQSSAVSVFVKVSDINDNAPHITFPPHDNYSVSIPSTLAVKTEILTVLAVDKDDGDNSRLSYILRHQDNVPKYFTVNQTTGRVILVKEIESAETQVYKLSLGVRDNGSPQLETWRHFSIHISVVNETAVFSEQQSGKYNLVIVISVIVMTAILSSVILATICIIRKRDQKHVEGDNIRPDLYDKAPAKKLELKNANVGEIVRGEQVLDSSSTVSTVQNSHNYQSALQTSSPRDQSSYAVQNSDLQMLEQQHLQYIRDCFPNDAGLDVSTISMTDSSTSRNHIVTNRKSSWMEEPKLVSSLKQPGYSSDGHRRSSQRHGSSKKYSRPNRVQWALQPDNNFDFPEPQTLPDDGKLGEDTTSDLSGDTATSDSGRGGSDDDVHRGYCLQIDHEGVHGHYV